MRPFRALRALRALPAAAVLTCCAACSATEEPAEEPAEPPAVASVAAPCAETVATPIAARPPTLANTTSAWYGVDDLWVGLPDYAPSPHGDTLVLRFPVVTLAQGEPTSDRGAPVVTASRTDAAGEAPGQVGAFSQAFGTDDLSFWPASVAFPEAGCWTVTGSLGAESVQFTVSVEEP